MSNRNTLSLGDRMKKYEETLDFKLNPCMEYVIRLDGKNFSKMVKKWKCQKPFDERFNKAMEYTSKKIFDIIPNIHAIWHGSDEISVWFSCPNVEDMYFEGRIQKLISLVSSQTSVYFNQKLQELFKDITIPFGIFDARIMQFPNKMEVSNYFLFRQRDHIKNSISGYARYFFSSKELMNKNSDEKIEMMKQKGFDYNSLSGDKLCFKYGTLLWKTSATIFKNKESDEYYTRTIITKRTDFKMVPSEFGIVFPLISYVFTENQWQEFKKDEQ